MSINISSGYINYRSQEVNNLKKILLMGAGNSNYKAREIIKPSSLEEVLSLYGENSDLYKAYTLLIDLGVTNDNIYTANCFAENDYIRLMDKVIQYDFSYLIPIGIYLSDKFYNPLTDKDEYYIAYFLEQLATVDNLTTILATEKHASLYEDFDSYLIDMLTKEATFVDYFEGTKFLNIYGHNLNFIYSNLKDIEYGNVILGALYCTRDHGKYLNNISGADTVYNIDTIDITGGSRAMYFKYNFYMTEVTVENTYNFKTTNDIYANALIDDVIKSTIRYVDISKYKGELYTPYVANAIENELNRKLKNLKGDLFKQYQIQEVSFKRTEEGAGFVVVNYSIIPFGTLEVINILMGVV